MVDGNTAGRQLEPIVIYTDIGMTAYQIKAVDTAIYPGKGEVTGLMYAALGLGEAGEAQGKISKIWRDGLDKKSKEVKEPIMAELGDILWFVAATAAELGYNLEDVAHANLKKLADRKARNVLGGNGDNR
jgi:hypothetical protein